MYHRHYISIHDTRTDQQVMDDRNAELKKALSECQVNLHPTEDPLSDQYNPQLPEVPMPDAGTACDECEYETDKRHKLLSHKRRVHVLDMHS